MKRITSRERASIFGSLKKLGYTEEQRLLMLQEEFGVKSLNDLTVDQVKTFKKTLVDSVKDLNKKEDKRRKMLIAVCYDKKMFLTGAYFDSKKLDVFLEAKSKHKIKFNDMNLVQLQDTIHQIKMFNK